MLHTALQAEREAAAALREQEEAELLKLAAETESPVAQRVLRFRSKVTEVVYSMHCKLFFAATYKNRRQ